MIRLASNHAMRALNRLTDNAHHASDTERRVSLARKSRFRRLRKLVVLMTRPAWRRAIRSGVAAAVEHRDVPFGTSFGTIIDVGAHNGQFALLARDRYPSADIVCIEPLPDAVNRLRTLNARDKRVSILQFAAGGVDERRSLHVSRETDSSSLLPILSPYLAAFPGTEETGIINVTVRTLDALLRPGLRRPTLLKIDVQGSELDVLAGASRLLTEVDVAYVECSFIEFYRGQALADQVVAAFLNCGLRLDGVYCVVRDGNGRCLQADMLFRRSR